MRRRFVGILAVIMLVALVVGARWSVSAATSNLYANNASSGAPYILVMDPSTFVVSDTLANLSGNNGRGVAVVNGIVYYTCGTPGSGCGSVYSYTLSSHTNKGVLFSAAGQVSLGTIAFDGTNFWIGDASGDNKAYLYTPTGTLLKTITLSNCSAGSCVGLEYFVQNGAGRLIANRAEGTPPYDVYDTNGALLTPSFITTGTGEGIAFDGTNFLVATQSGGFSFNALAKFNGTTGAAIGSRTPVTGGLFAANIQDLSFDYAVTLGTPTSTPTPTPTQGVPSLSFWGIVACAATLLITGSRMVRDKLNGA